MLDAALKALGQILTPPFRKVLLKSIGLAIAFLFLIGVALSWLLTWLTGEGGQWVETTLGSVAHYPVVALGWLLAFAIGLGLFVGAIFLMPAVTSLVAGFFSDEIAEHVEREYYPADPPGVALPVMRAALEGLRVGLLALGVYLLCLPFLLFAGLGVVMFFLATAYLLGREYFELAAMRYVSAEDAKTLRKENTGMVFVAGMFIAAFVSIPIVNFATPLFGTAFMVHMHKRLAAARAGNCWSQAGKRSGFSGFASPEKMFLAKNACDRMLTLLSGFPDNLTAALLDEHSYEVAPKVATAAIASALLASSIGMAQALTVTFGGGGVNSPPFPGYGTTIEKNNVVNSPLSGNSVTDTSNSPGGGTMIGTVGNNHAVATVGVAPAGGYKVDWYFIGAESGFDVTLNVPSLSPYTEHNQNNQCSVASCGALASGNVVGVGQIGPQFLGTTINLATETTLNFSLTAMAGAAVQGTLANGNSNPAPGGHPSPGNTAASLVFSYASLTSGNSPLKTWTLSPTQVLDSGGGIWFLFAFNDTGGPDDNHDDFVGMARVYADDPQGGPGPVPISGALPLFATGLGMFGFIAHRRKRKQTA